MAVNLQPLLLEALAARSGSAPDPALQALLSGTATAETAGVIPTPQELLSQLESTNPTLGRIAKYLTALRAAERESVIEAEPDAEVDTLQAEEDPLLDQVVQRLKEHVKELRAELDQLRERNDTLASALGACYLCWGEDPGCPVCRGTGRPGSRKLEQESFEQWVAPALRTLSVPKEVHPPKSSIELLNGSLEQVKTLKGEQNEQR